jgi:8-oxo-dGTP pyrophosphatase MutT (NUDIX family)
VDFEGLAQQVTACLDGRSARGLDAGERTPAGVLVPLFPDPADGLSTVLTVRTQTVRDHKGQVSFPGGTRDASDADLEATALRETEEELAVPRHAVRIVGRLDDCPTLTGYLIRPFVGLLRERPEVRPSPIEIDRVLWTTLSALAAPGAHRLERVESGGWSVETYVFRVEGVVVWGATARMLVDLVDRLRPLLTTTGG